MTEPQQLADRLDVSVIIPAYNGAALIGNQLDALARQETNLTWEVIVADNGSTDATPDILRQRAASFPVDLRVVDASARQGAGQARNVGARASRGAVLLFCDCDDEVMSGWVLGAWQALQESHLVGGPNHELREPRDAAAPVVNPGTLWGRGEVKGVHSCNMGVRRESFFRAGGFDESLPPYGCEDVELAIRLYEAGCTVSPAPRMRIHFRRTIGSVALLRKVFMSGLAESVVWEHHRDRFAGQVGRTAAWRALLTWPAQKITEVARTRQFDLRDSARDLATRIAHVWAYQTLLKGGRVPDPILLTPADDPLRQTAPSPPTVAVAEDNHDH